MFWDATKFGWNFYPCKIPAHPFFTSLHSSRLPSPTDHSLNLKRYSFPDGRLVRTWPSRLFKIPKRQPNLPSRYLWTGITFNVCPAGGDIQNRHFILKQGQSLKTKEKKKNCTTRLESTLFKLPVKCCDTIAAIFTSTHSGVNGIQMVRVPQKDKASPTVPGNLGQGKQSKYSPRSRSSTGMFFTPQWRKNWSALRAELVFSLQ